MGLRVKEFVIFTLVNLLTEAKAIGGCPRPDSWRIDFLTLGCRNSGTGFTAADSRWIWRLMFALGHLFWLMIRARRGRSGASLGGANRSENFRKRRATEKKSVPPVRSGWMIGFHSAESERNERMEDRNWLKAENNIIKNQDGSAFCIRRKGTTTTAGRKRNLLRWTKDLQPTDEWFRFSPSPYRSFGWFLIGGQLRRLPTLQLAARDRSSGQNIAGCVSSFWPLYQHSSAVN